MARSPERGRRSCSSAPSATDCGSRPSRRPWARVRTWRADGWSEPGRAAEPTRRSLHSALVSTPHSPSPSRGRNKSNGVPDLVPDRGQVGERDEVDAEVPAFDLALPGTGDESPFLVDQLHEVRLAGETTIEHQGQFFQCLVAVQRLDPRRQNSHLRETSTGSGRVDKPGSGGQRDRPGGAMRRRRLLGTHRHRIGTVYHHLIIFQAGRLRLPAERHPHRHRRQHHDDRARRHSHLHARRSRPAPRDAGADRQGRDRDDAVRTALLHHGEPRR